MNNPSSRGALGWVASAAFLATLLHSPTCGAQTRTAGPQPSKPAVQTAPKPPATVTTAPGPTSSQQEKPLFDPAILAAIAKNWQQPDFHAVEAELNNAQKDVDAKQSGLSGAMSQLGMRIAVCSTFKYSAADQKNAGCTGNDTVSQCTQKLFAECTKASHANFVSKRAQMLESISRLEKALQAFSAALPAPPTNNTRGVGLRP
jgi:hypothetical protein